MNPGAGDERPFDRGRPRPIATVLDSLRARIDFERFDSVVLWIECVAADLGFGDVRPLPGAVAWVEELRGAGKRTALVASGERASAALELAGLSESFDVVVTGSRTVSTLERAVVELGSDVESSVAVDVEPVGIRAAREAGFHLAIGVARGYGTPEQLRQAGAEMIVADLQELIGA